MMESENTGAAIINGESCFSSCSFDPSDGSVRCIDFPAVEGMQLTAASSLENGYLVVAGILRGQSAAFVTTEQFQSFMPVTLPLFDPSSLTGYRISALAYDRLTGLLWMAAEPNTAGSGVWLGNFPFTATSGKLGGFARVDNGGSNFRSFFMSGATFLSVVPSGSGSILRLFGTAVGKTGTVERVIASYDQGLSWSWIKTGNHVGSVRSAYCTSWGCVVGMDWPSTPVSPFLSIGPCDNNATFINHPSTGYRPSPAAGGLRSSFAVAVSNYKDGVDSLVSSSNAIWLWEHGSEKLTVLPYPGSSLASIPVAFRILPSQQIVIAHSDGAIFLSTSSALGPLEAETLAQSPACGGVIPARRWDSSAQSGRSDKSDQSASPVTVALFTITGVFACLVFGAFGLSLSKAE
jgi:hypothetical protein